MTDKEKLNSILRLRLEFCTETEYSAFVGRELKGNHFSRLNDFLSEAYYSMFARECSMETNGNISLTELLYQYEATSQFYQDFIDRTRHKTDKAFIPCLLRHIYWHATPDKRKTPPKCVALCKAYDEHNREGELNIAILLLLTYGLLPTFKNKSAQDVTDIIDDFQQAYDILMDIARTQREGATTRFKEILCLREMRMLIEEERAGDKFLNRLMLIYITGDILDRIFALATPAKIREYNTELVTMGFELPYLWRSDEEAENIVWEIVENDLNGYYLFRNEIDYAAKKIRYTRYQLTFKDIGNKHECFTFIMQPAYNYHNLLHCEVPMDDLSFDYTHIEYREDGKTVHTLSFTKDSPLGHKPLTLRDIEHDDIYFYYKEYLDRRDAGEDFEKEDAQPQYQVAVEYAGVAITKHTISFEYEDVTYVVDKFDKEGNETIAGITALTHDDNIVFATLKDEGRTRQFLCLDSINQNLDMEELITKPYCHILLNFSELFE